MNPRPPFDRYPVSCIHPDWPEWQAERINAGRYFRRSDGLVLWSPWGSGSTFARVLRTEGVDNTRLGEQPIDSYAPGSDELSALLAKAAELHPHVCPPPRVGQVWAGVSPELGAVMVTYERASTHVGGVPASWVISYNVGRYHVQRGVPNCQDTWPDIDMPILVAGPGAPWVPPGWREKVPSEEIP